MNPLTVLIPTHNEEANLPACLDSVRWADEIFIVDSFSTDRTLAIARNHGARVVQHEYSSHAAQRNWAIPQARHEWILLLDADERVTPALQEEIQTLLQTAPPKKAYQICRRTFYFGRELKHGGFSHDWVTRLFHRDAGEIEEWGFHGEMKLPFTPGRLRGRLLHYTCRTIEDYFSRFQLYTTGQAQLLFRKNKRAGFSHLVLRPAWRFFQLYILKRGFLDGWLGLLICTLSGFYVFTKYMKLWLLQQGEAQDHASQS